VAPVIRESDMGVLYAASRDGRWAVSGGHWDTSVRCVMTSDPGFPRQVLYYHRDVVTCVAMSSSGLCVVTGSRDTTVVVWDVVDQKSGSSSAIHVAAMAALASDPVGRASGKNSLDGGPSGENASSTHELRKSVTAAAASSAHPLGAQSASSVTSNAARWIIDQTPRLVLRGHTHALMFVCVSEELGIVLSGDVHGHVIIHSICDGSMFRSRTDRWISRAVITSCGEIVSYSRRNSRVYVDTINFGSIAELTCPRTFVCDAMIATSDGRVVALGSRSGVVELRSTWDLTLLYEYPPLDSAVTSMVLSADETVLFVGLSSGKLHAFSVDREPLRERYVIPNVVNSKAPWYIL